MPAGARSSARPFASPTSPAFEALYAASPWRGPLAEHRAGEDQPPALAHHPGGRPGPEERAGEVHLEHLAPHRRVGPERSGRRSARSPALQIQTSTPPHSATVASATASLNAASVTSPPSTSDGPGSSSATALRSFSVRATSATQRAAVREGVREQPAEPPAGTGDHHPLPRHVARAGEGGGDLDLLGHRPFSFVVPISTVHSSCSATARSMSSVLDRRPPRDAPADARDPRVRGAGRRALPRRRGARLRAPVDRAGGFGGRRLLAARAGRRDHVDPSRPRPLPRQGSRPARDVRRADGQGRRAPTAAGAARCTSPTRRIGIFGANGIVAAGLPIAVGRGDGGPAARTTAAWRWRSSATARSPRAPSTRRSTSPRSGSCRWSSSARTTATRSSRRPRRSTRRRSSAVPPATASTTSRSTATTWWRPPRRCSDVVEALRAGAGPAIVEAATYRWHGHYEGDPQRYRSPEEVRGVGGAGPARRPRAIGFERRASSRRRLDRTARRRSRASSTTRSTQPGGCAARRPRRCTDFVVRAATGAPEPPAAGRRRPGVPHDGRDPRRARSRARQRRAGVRRRHRRRRRAATSSA